MRDIKSIITNQRSCFETGRTKEPALRREQLRILREAIRKNESEIMEALRKDLNKAPFESYATEIGMVLEEIKYARNHLNQWARPRKVKTPLTQFPASSYIYAEPYGVALIIAPWNYPFQLAIAPLVAAIAAGNCAIVKPSEYAPHTSRVITGLLRDNFDESFITVVEGGIETSQKLLEEKYDYIFFTGGGTVGRIVMAAAAQHLTSVTLELGGKSPCIVDATANLDLAAQRIVWGKFLNAGQTCVAPDYLLVQSTVKVAFIAKLQETIVRFFGSDPCSNAEYPKIVNERHFERLLHLMQDGKVVWGGRSNARTLQIAPTLLEEVTWENAVMREEIFGPLLPILEFEDLREATAKIRQHPRPLALYLFTTNSRHEREITHNVSFGGGCINDTVVHLATSQLPFGGVGESGMGGYHGKAGFDTFSHRKSILKKSNWLDIPLRYPPYKNRLALLKKLMG
jgi:aldehyde dehydrogenase (NAD+)